MTRKEENTITKTYLRQVFALTKRIRRGQEELKRLKEERTYIGAIQYGGEHVQSSTDGLSPAMCQAQRIADAEIKVSRLIVRRIELRERIIGQIEGLDDTVSEDILSARYVDGKDFEDISMDLGYSYDYVLHRHGEALAAFFEKYLAKDSRK